MDSECGTVAQRGFREMASARGPRQSCSPIVSTKAKAAQLEGYLTLNLINDSLVVRANVISRCKDLMNLVNCRAQAYIICRLARTAS